MATGGHHPGKPRAPGQVRLSDPAPAHPGQGSSHRDAAHPASGGVQEGRAGLTAQESGGLSVQESAGQEAQEEAMMELAIKARLAEHVHVAKG